MGPYLEVVLNWGMGLNLGREPIWAVGYNLDDGSFGDGTQFAGQTHL